MAAEKSHYPHFQFWGALNKGGVGRECPTWSIPKVGSALISKIKSHHSISEKLQIVNCVNKNDSVGSRTGKSLGEATDWLMRLEKNSIFLLKIYVKSKIRFIRYQCTCNKNKGVKLFSSCHVIYTFIQNHKYRSTVLDIVRALENCIATKKKVKIHKTTYGQASILLNNIFLLYITEQLHFFCSQRPLKCFKSTQTWDKKANE